MTEPATASVLVVDDEPDLAELYEEWLGSRYDVEVVHDGSGALGHVDETTDVVLLDRRLPDMSGEAVLGGIRDRGLTCQVVILSAIEPGLDVLDVGFDDYLTKPTARATLVRAVSRALTRQSYARNYQRFLSLSTKLATVEAAMDVEDLEGSSAYADLAEEFTALAADLATMAPVDEEYGDLYETKLQLLLENTLSKDTRPVASSRS